VSINSNKNEDIICRKLINRVLNDCANGDTDDSVSYNNSVFGLNRNKIGIISSDGNWSYHRLVKCNQRKIVKIKKDKKGKFLRDEKDNLIKETTKREYKNNKTLLDCDKHIIDKAETCLVETMNGSLRGRFARFNRRTKSYSKSYTGLYNAVFLWVNRDMLLENRVRYSSYCRNEGQNVDNIDNNGMGEKVA
jgi:hypothetical protein